MAIVLRPQICDVISPYVYENGGVMKFSDYIDTPSENQVNRSIA